MSMIIMMMLHMLHECTCNFAKKGGGRIKWGMFLLFICIFIYLLIFEEGRSTEFAVEEIAKYLKNVGLQQCNQ